MNPATSIHNFLDKRHSITFTLAWSTFFICLSALQFGYHLAELNAPGEILSCNFKKPGPLPSYDDTIWSHLNFRQCIKMPDYGVALVTTMFTIGGLLASIVLGFTSVCSTYGRKQLCTVAALFYFLGSSLMSFSQTNWQINLGRLLSGVGAGSSLIMSPILINELAPHNHRGLLGSLMQFAVSLGILLAQVFEIQHWKHLLTNNLVQQDEEQTETSSLLSHESQSSFDPPSISTWKFLSDLKYRNQLIAVVLIMTGQQWSGVNTITYYGVQVLNGIFNNPDGNMVLFLSCLISTVNVLVSVGVAPLIDKWGRKPLLMSSVVICGVSALSLAIGIPTKNDAVVVTAFFSFIIGFGIGLGPIPFLMISEFTGHDVVTIAQSFGTVMNWCSNMSVAMFFPILTKLLGGGLVFSVFAINCLLYGIGFYYNIPETKGFNHSNDVWENFK
ncbi:putative metabolite transport protein [Candida tropicalis]